MIFAKYTIVLKTLLDDPQSKALIDKALSTYPLYTAENESKFTQVMTREELNKRILDHFKYREIGFETFGRWLDELEIAMNEIMPYYNQLFLSEDVINGLEDIFGNVDIKVEFEQEITGNKSEDIESSANGTITGTDTLSSTSKTDTTSESNSEGSDTSKANTSMDNKDKEVKSDTPQSQLSITAENIDSVSYADHVNWKKADSESETNTTGTTISHSQGESESNTTSSSEGNKEESRSETGSVKNTGTNSETTKNTLTRKGNHGVNTYAHDMLEFRTLFINIAQQIIKDPRIQELFMQVY